MQELGGEYSDSVRSYSDNIFNAPLPLSVSDIESEQNHISGYGVSEYASAEEVGIYIEESAGDAQNARGGNFFSVAVGVFQMGHEQNPSYKLPSSSRWMDKFFPSNHPKVGGCPFLGRDMDPGLKMVIPHSRDLSVGIWVCPCARMV